MTHALPPDRLLPLQLDLTPDQEAFQERLRGWLATHPPPDESATNGRRELLEIRRSWQRTLAADRLVGISWPRQYGGLGADPVTQFLYYEELAAAGAPELPNRPGLVLIGPTLMAHADEATNHEFLPRILDATHMWAQCFSEPDVGSDLAALRTTGTVDGDSLRIDGQKTWVTMGDVADFAVVLCRTGDRAERHRTLSMAIVDLRQPGVEVRPIRQSNGEAEFSDVFFDGARAAIEHLIAGLNRGWEAAMTLLEFERGDRLFTDHSALLRRIEAAHLDLLAMDGDSDTYRVDELWRTYADVRARAHALREMNVDIVRRRQQGLPIGAYASPVKAFWGELTQDVAELHLHLADLSEGISERAVPAYLAGRMATIYSGTIDIQRSIIAERVLGLPRPPTDRRKKETAS